MILQDTVRIARLAMSEAVGCNAIMQDPSTEGKRQDLTLSRSKGQVEYVIEIVADRVQFGAPGLMVALPLIKDGKLVPLVVATPQRSPLLPDVPTALEVAPGWGRDGSQAWLAPAGTPRAIRQQISKEMARNLALPEVKTRLQNMGFFIAPASPEEHEKNLRADIEIFSRLVKELGMTAK